MHLHHCDITINIQLDRESGEASRVPAETLLAEMLAESPEWEDWTEQLSRQVILALRSRQNK